jgi:Firmicute plasmid replication protein (RepL)
MTAKINAKVPFKKSMTKQVKAEIETRHGIELYHHNPFVPDVRVRSRRVTNKRGDMMLVDAATGEINASIAGFWESKEVDSTRFVKLFINGVRALAELSNAGTKVFEILYIELQENIGKDRIYLHYKNVDKNETSLSERTFRRGLAELLDKKFIALTPTVGWYWINPDFVWNGDRITFVQEYYKKAENKYVDQHDSIEK